MGGYVQCHPGRISLRLTYYIGQHSGHELGGSTGVHSMDRIEVRFGDDKHHGDALGGQGVSDAVVSVCYDVPRTF